MQLWQNLNAMCRNEFLQGTYEYGGQLVNGARVLRLSCRISLESNAGIFSRLRQAWRQFRSVSQEQLTRLRVCAVFHRNVEDVRERKLILNEYANPKVAQATLLGQKKIIILHVMYSYVSSINFLFNLFKALYQIAKLGGNGDDLVSCCKRRGCNSKVAYQNRYKRHP